MQTDARVGVDVGGTFTDVVAVRDGVLSTLKTPSTPDAPEEAVLAGIRRVDGETPPDAVSFLGHGTTVATNAVLERDWADTALVTTSGFRDALEIGRQNRPAIYDLRGERPPPVVERHRRFEVEERLDRRGDVVTPLDEADVGRVARAVDDAGVESVAVSLLFSFENASHERRVHERLSAEVDASFSLSSEVLPEMREYERTLATALNAALKPTMNGYVGRLAEGVADLGVPASPRIMQSNGGVVDADVARKRPVNALLSGPAAGVRGAAHVAGRAGHDDVLAMDMGGTSCDVSLVRDGDPVVTREGSVGEYPVGVPMVDVHTIGAGGGSVAWVDDGGALRVGPASAGADPGPICYGRGGTDPTVTDAHALLGRIDPTALFDDAASEDEVRAGLAPVADELDASVEAAAQGVLDVANASMERALRVVSVERGHDPRTLTLVAYGGAGPLHAPRLARALDVPRVLVPATAGVLSALGLLISDVVYDYSSSMVRPWAETDPTDLAAAFEEFEARGAERLAAEGFEGPDATTERSLDLRYAGQSFDLTVAVPDGPPEAAMDEVAARFHERHRERYGHASPDEPLELAAVRLRAVGRVDPPELAAATPADADGRPTAERTVTFDGDAVETPVYERRNLPPGASFEGPAVVAGDESTTVVHPDQSVDVDDVGNLVVDA